MIPAIGVVSSLFFFAHRDDDAASPLPTEEFEAPSGITRKQWLEFVKGAAAFKSDHVEGSRLGIFGLTIRRLSDLGIMENPKVKFVDNIRQWDATWIKPYSFRYWASRPMQQYEVFCESCKRYLDNQTIRNRIGTAIDSITLSLSGVLMGLHRAGCAGFKHWLDSDKVREQFPDTTIMIQKLNGIF